MVRGTAPHGGHHTPGVRVPAPQGAAGERGRPAARTGAPDAAARLPHARRPGRTRPERLRVAAHAGPQCLRAARLRRGVGTAGPGAGPVDRFGSLRRTARADAGDERRTARRTAHGGPRTADLRGPPAGQASRTGRRTHGVGPFASDARDAPRAPDGGAVPVGTAVGRPRGLPPRTPCAGRRARSRARPDTEPAAGAGAGRRSRPGLARGAEPCRASRTGRTRARAGPRGVAAARRRELHRPPGATRPGSTRAGGRPAGAHTCAGRLRPGRFGQDDSRGASRARGRGPVPGRPDPAEHARRGRAGHRPRHGR